VVARLANFSNSDGVNIGGGRSDGRGDLGGTVAPGGSEGFAGLSGVVVEVLDGVEVPVAVPDGGEVAVAVADGVGGVGEGDGVSSGSNSVSQAASQIAIPLPVQFNPG